MKVRLRVMKVVVIEIKIGMRVSRILYERVRTGI